MPRKRLSPLPDVPRDADPATRRWMNAVKESLEVRLGRRGDPKEAAVTFSDLLDAGLARGLGGVNPRTGLPGLGPVINPGDGTDGGVPDLGTPPVPGNVAALGVFGGIHVLWDKPEGRPDVTLTEIRRGTVDDLELADDLGGAGGNTYFDIITPDAAVTYFYWVRHITVYGREGPWSASVTATKEANVDYILDRISGEIAENDFVQSLQDRIDLIDGVEPGSVNARIADLQTLVENEDQALAEDITTVQTTLGDEIVSVQQTLTSEIEQVEDDVFEIGAQATLALDVDGYVSGYTIYNDGTTSGIVFLTDQFALAAPGNPDVYPFVFDVNDGTAYLNEVVIKDASIESAKIGSVTFNKITEPDGTPVTTVGGLLRADMIDVGNLTVQEAATFTGVAESDNYVAGVSGWRLHPDGTAEFGGRPALSQGLFAGTNIAIEATLTSTDISSGSLFDLIDGAKAIGETYVNFGVGAQSVTLDFGSAKYLSRSYLYFYAGDDRTYQYAIAVSQNDDDDWVFIVGDGDSDGTVTAYETSRDADGQQATGDEFPTIDEIGQFGRYLRVYCNGSTANNNSHLYEIEVYNLSPLQNDPFWIRPGSTLIDGNKIFTGDAYVDTLQIRGQAVTIPVGSYAGGNQSFGTGWATLRSATINSSGAPIIIQCCAALAVSGQATVEIRVLESGTGVVFSPGAVLGPVDVGFVSPTIIRTPGNRSVTYSFQARRVGPSSSSVGAARSIVLLEAKR